MKYKNNISLKSKPKAYQTIIVKNTVAVYPGWFGEKNIARMLDSEVGIDKRTYLQFVRKRSIGISIFRAKKQFFLAKKQFGMRFGVKKLSLYLVTYLALSNGNQNQLAYEPQPSYITCHFLSFVWFN